MLYARRAVHAMNSGTRGPTAAGAIIWSKRCRQNRSCERTTGSDRGFQTRVNIPVRANVASREGLTGLDASLAYPRWHHVSFCRNRLARQKGGLASRLGQADRGQFWNWRRRAYLQTKISNRLLQTAIEINGRAPAKAAERIIDHGAAAPRVILW